MGILIGVDTDVFDVLDTLTRDFSLSVWFLWKFDGYVQVIRISLYCPN